jgi:hypothetical protein
MHVGRARGGAVIVVLGGRSRYGGRHDFMVDDRLGRLVSIRGEVVG